jgi:hypothetical protein
VIECGTWTQCNTAAIAKGGQMVTIRSAAENAWLMSTFPTTNDYGYWIGYKRTGSTWAWSSGETSAYTNWQAGEPNGGVGNLHDYAHMYGRSFSTVTLGRWNDTTNASLTSPLTTQTIVEYR